DRARPPAAERAAPLVTVSIVVSNATTGESSSARAKTISVTHPPTASGGKGSANSDWLSSSQQMSPLWESNAKLHEEMVASLHAALVPRTVICHCCTGPVGGSVGIEGGVVSGVINLESLGVRAPSRRPRHENRYHDA